MKDSEAVDNQEETELQSRRDKFAKSQTCRSKESQHTEEVHDDLPSTSQFSAKEDLSPVNQLTTQGQENLLLILTKKQKENLSSVNKEQESLPFKKQTESNNYSSANKMPQVSKPYEPKSRVRRPPPGFKPKPEGQSFSTTQNLGANFNHVCITNIPA